MKLRKTIHHETLGVFRIFELFPSVFQVIDARGRTVDEFFVIEIGGGAGGVSVKQVFRHKSLRVGVPDFAQRFVSELNAARQYD
jgi:hypothetical protein